MPGDIRVKQSGWTFNKQIAEQLNISMKTVESQMTTAFVRLRKRVGMVVVLLFYSKFLKNFSRGKFVFGRYKEHNG